MKPNQKKLPIIMGCIFFLILFISIFTQIFAKPFITTGISRQLTDTEKETEIETSDENACIQPKKRIALTFDDGPHPVYTLKLLDGLKERNVKATFFVIGDNASNHPEILKRISEDGHIIGNHTFSHVQLSCITKDKAVYEITKTNEIIETTTGQTVEFIRPPYGSLPKELKSETNLTPVLWTIDPRDWSVLNTDSVVNHIVMRAKDGDIILLHDIFETSVDAALIVVDRLSAEGFEFVTVKELFDN